MAYGGGKQMTNAIWDKYENSVSVLRPFNDFFFVGRSVIGIGTFYFYTS